MSNVKSTANEYITRIYGYTHVAEGVGSLRGKPVFIPLAARGDTIRFEITEEKKGFLRGKLLEIVEPAPWRTTTKCGTYHNCGGCHLLHLNYEEQLYFKQQRVVSALQRIGRLKHGTVNPVLGMDDPWHYRHTARFHVRQNGDNFEIGYYRLKSHILEQIQDCPLLPEDFAPLRNAIAEFLGKLKGCFRIPVRQMVLRKGRATGDLLVQLLADDFPEGIDRESISSLAVEFPNLRSVVISLINRPEAPGMVLFGHNFYTESISGTRFRIPAGAFFQNNPAQTEVLLQTVSSFSDAQPRETLIDLYCGVGLFAHSLAPMVKRVYGIEENKTAVAAAVENADINGTKNTLFIRDRVEKALPCLAKKGIKPDTVILDPPRQGSSPLALIEICNMSPNRIVYVSCDPATLARDLALLTGKGYETREIQPIDMFPHTAHVETVVGIQRQKTDNSVNGQRKCHPQKVIAGQRKCHSR